MGAEKQQRIREKLKRMAIEAVGVSSLLGTVVSVTASTCTIKDDDTDVEYTDVRLQSIEGIDSGVLIVPQVGSFVLAIKVEDDEDYVIVSYSQISKISFKVGNSVFEQGLSTFKVENSTANLKEIIDLIIDAVMVIVVGTGTPPDYTKLTDAKTKLATLLQ